MDYFEFAETYKPIKNHLANEERPYDNEMFETFDEEIKFVCEKANENPLKVATIIEGESGKFWIMQGFHLVNRIGYFITEEEMPEGFEFCDDN